MSNTFKKFCATLLTVILILSVSVPFFAFGGTEALDPEIKPAITATFTDADGTVYDGNNLVAGEYIVNIMLSGMSTVSIFQIDANYTDDIAINSISTIADTDTSLECGADVIEDNSLIAIIATKNDDYSVIADPATMITMNVTVRTDGDFANYISFNTDPDLTFIEASYAQGFDDAYVWEGNTDSSFATVSIDMSPVPGASTYDVTGQIVIATDSNLSTANMGIVGITVSVDGTDISAVTDNDGYYTLSGLEEGTYTLSIAGPTTIDRTVTLEVSSDKTVEALPMVICDYNHDGFINNGDTAFFGGYIADYYVYADINADGFVNNGDTAFYGGFVGETINYQDVTL